MNAKTVVANVEILTYAAADQGLSLAVFGRDCTYRTVKPAVRHAKQNQAASDEQGEGLTWYVLETEDDFRVVRDWHESDFGRYQQVVR